MKNKALKHLSNGVVITSLSPNGGRGEVCLRARFDADGISADMDALRRRLKEVGAASMWFDQKSQVKNDNFNYDSIADVLPAESDFITVPFRALSKRVVEGGHFLDFTRDGVLEAAVPLLAGQTVYPNHDFTDINNALGSVASAKWDGEDEAGVGVPGINALYKIDALMNPRISRLLLMKPPGIHSTSLTIPFEFEYSHPELVEQRRFWDLLGTEVEGEIVRLIVTKILAIWEASLVFQGADSTAKGIVASTEDDEDSEQLTVNSEQLSGKTDLRSGTSNGGTGNGKPPNSNEERTMKLTTEQKAQLGIEFDGEDVPEAEIVKAGLGLAKKVDDLSDAIKLDELQAAAEAGRVLLEEKREAVTAKAKLAELGSEDGDLDEIVVDQLKAADAAALAKLEKYYDKRIGERFPNGRSSKEDPAAAGAEAGDEPAQMEKAVPADGLFS